MNVLFTNDVTVHEDFTCVVNINKKKRTCMMLTVRFPKNVYVLLCSFKHWCKNGETSGNFRLQNMFCPNNHKLFYLMLTIILSMVLCINKMRKV